MKKKIILSLALVLAVFLAGSVIAVLYVTKAARRMDNLIMLHQVEILREELIIRVQQVQSHIYRNKVRSGGEVDVLIAQVQEMDRVMDSCMGCHHSPELTQGLLGMRDTADDYKTAISRLVTTSGNQERFAALEHRAQEIGQELIAMTQGMAFTANMSLHQKTQGTMSTVWEVRKVLYGTLAAGFLLTGVAAFLLGKSLDRRIRRLSEAARRIARGDLHHRVDVIEGEDREFAELGNALNDMTRNLRHTQRQLVQSAKFSAIREMATTIAYEINNPLTGVHGYVDLLLKADDIPADKKEQLKTIERETLRARDILKNLLDFSRRRPPRLVKTDLAALIQETIPLVSDQARLGNVEIRCACAAGLPLVPMDAGEMKQVFLNVITNAFHAMPAGGSLTIRCGQREDLSGKAVVTVEIIDTGRGIPEEQLDKVFDPFFTTQSDGEETGLGLSMSYLIVHNHGGRIEVESTVGEGSSFTVVLPV